MIERSALESSQLHRNQKRPLAGALADHDNTKGAASVLLSTIFGLPESVKSARFNIPFRVYNSVTHRARLKRRSAAGVDAPTTLLTPTSERTLRIMSGIPNSTISPDNRIDESQPERSPADRLVLALRYPGAPDAEPLCAVRRQIGGRVYLLAVYDADVRDALVRMGWEVA